MNPRTLSRMNFRVSFRILLKFYPSVAWLFDGNFRIRLRSVIVGSFRGWIFDMKWA